MLSSSSATFSICHSHTNFQPFWPCVFRVFYYHARGSCIGTLLLLVSSMALALKLLGRLSVSHCNLHLRQGEASVLDGRGALFTRTLDLNLNSTCIFPEQPELVNSRDRDVTELPALPHMGSLTCGE